MEQEILQLNDEPMIKDEIKPDNLRSALGFANGLMQGMIPPDEVTEASPQSVQNAQGEETSLEMSQDTTTDQNPLLDENNMGVDGVDNNVDSYTEEHKKLVKSIVEETVKEEMEGLREELKDELKKELADDTDSLGEEQEEK